MGVVEGVIGADGADIALVIPDAIGQVAAEFVDEHAINPPFFGIRWVAKLVGFIHRQHDTIAAPLDQHGQHVPIAKGGFVQLDLELLDVELSGGIDHGGLPGAIFPVGIGEFIPIRIPGE